MLFFYFKKTCLDHEPSIDLDIYCSRTLLGQLAKWEAHRETRAPPGRQEHGVWSIPRSTLSLAVEERVAS
jgi:hypothetical protein